MRVQPERFKMTKQWWQQKWLIYNTTCFFMFTVSNFARSFAYVKQIVKTKTCNFDHQFQKIPSCDVNILLGGGFNSFKTESAKFKPFPTRAEPKKNKWNHHPNSTLRLPRQTDALVSTSWFNRLVSPTNSNKCLPCCDFLQPSDPKHWF